MFIRRERNRLYILSTYCWEQLNFIGDPLKSFQFSIIFLKFYMNKRRLILNYNYNKIKRVGSLKKVQEGANTPAILAALLKPLKTTKISIAKFQKLVARLTYTHYIKIFEYKDLPIILHEKETEKVFTLCSLLLDLIKAVDAEVFGGSSYRDIEYLIKVDMCLVLHSTPIFKVVLARGGVHKTLEYKG